ncbi:DUF2849 domain-containing protein [Rhodovulum steppense]|uniref:Uncharacterized protein DUF2849 n=1 Tax=Rhodovulum steppense TaxID=540251 RepID=A0A4R1YTC1_9RHOB|nr:DUF2849 domain-containing protein [Rhodovulum steppense]TCM83537.1 uncharacterized protein DUF2849 [Rhodovulum steppense]
MSRIVVPVVVAANDLFDGDPVWMTPGGNWSRSLADAEVIGDLAEAQARLAAAMAQADRVVGAYMAEVRPGPFGPVPVDFRERVRARGPAPFALPAQAAE